MYFESGTSLGDIPILVGVQHIEQSINLVFSQSVRVQPSQQLGARKFPIAIYVNRCKDFVGFRPDI